MLVAQDEWKQQRWMMRNERRKGQAEIEVDKTKQMEIGIKFPEKKRQKSSVHLQYGKMYFIRGALQDNIKGTEWYHQYHYKVGRNQYCP